MMGRGSLVGRALQARRADGSESRPYPRFSSLRLGVSAPCHRYSCPRVTAKDFLAEGKGFEPPEPCGSSDFESDAIDHSATPPNQDY